MQKQTYIQDFNIIPHGWNTSRIGLDVICVVTNINGITGNLGSVVTDISINVWNFITIVYNFNLFKKVKNCLLCLLIVDSLINNKTNLHLGLQCCLIYSQCFHDCLLWQHCSFQLRPILDFKERCFFIQSKSLELLTLFTYNCLFNQQSK